MDWYGLANFASGNYKNIEMEEIELLKEELRQTKLAYQMAAQMSQFKSGFLARTSHEVRSPLSSLMGLHQLIINDLCENPEEEREFIAQAYESAKKLMQIIDQFIAVSQLESGSTPVDLESIEISSIFEEIDALVHLQAASNRLPVEILSADRPIYVVADRARLQQVLLTLIDTAISVMKKNSIQGQTRVRAISAENSNLVKIEIDVHRCPGYIWTEPVNLLEQKTNITPEEVRNFSKELEMSPGMKFMLCSSLLETMAGQLILKDLSAESNDAHLTQLQCLIPLDRG